MSGLTTAAGAMMPLSTVSTVSEPAAVQNGSPAVKRAWSEAVSFEQMLLSQLTQAMSQSAGLGEAGSEGEGSEGEGSSTTADGGGLLSSMVPQTLSESVSNAGGLGLASQLLSSIAPEAQRASGAAPVVTSGASGAAPPASGQASGSSAA